MIHNTTYKIFFVVSLLLFFCMFVYSGINKIIRFDKKSSMLNKKLSGLKQRSSISDIGISLVVVLEIFVSLFIVAYLIYRSFISESEKQKMRHKFILISILAMLGVYSLFMVVVTLLYHMPSKKAMIPFLSNMTTLGGFLFLGLIVYRELES